MVDLTPKLAAIVSAIRQSDKSPATFFTVKAVDGSRHCFVDGESVRVTEPEYFQILKFAQPATAFDPEQQAKWKLQRRAVRD